MSNREQWMTPGGAPQTVSADGREVKVELSGYLTPNNTRTDPVLSALLMSFKNGGGVAKRAFPLVVTPKRKVKQYVLSQDHFRRYPGSGAQLVKEPGSATKKFDMRIDSRTITTQPYGLHACMTADDRNEADEGVPVREIAVMGIESVLDLELEYQAVTKLTTSANYATGHTSDVANWNDDTVATIVRNMNTALTAIKTDCGASSMDAIKALVLGLDGWNILKESAEVLAAWVAHASGTPNSSGTPGTDFIAGRLGVDEIYVSEMAAGPATLTTSLPVVTSNALVWPSTNDTAALLLLSRGVRTTGRAALGEWTAAFRASRYERQVQSWFGDESTSDQGGPVEFVQVLDEWSLEWGAINDTTNQDSIGGYLFTGLTT
jgi:hypothetical protein